MSSETQYRFLSSSDSHRICWSFDDAEGNEIAIKGERMIISNRRHMFGFSHFGVVQVSTFGCAVITAPEGLFKGCSTIFQAFEGDWANAEGKRLVAKAMLYPGLSKKQRAEVHDAFLIHLDMLGNIGLDLTAAINEVFATAKEKGFVVDSVNQADASEGARELDPSEAAKAMSSLIEENRLQAEADAQRLSALIREVAGRIGEAPVAFNEDGEAFVRPELARELERPGNEMLREMLLMGARANARRRE